MYRRRTVTGWHREVSMIRYIEKDHPEYPKRLRKLPGMPSHLYVNGCLPREEQPTVGIVGARRCTNYGKQTAREFARVFSDWGIQVVSGMAMGVDGESHRGALQGKTPTFAVLGCGVDICYPSCNGDLFGQIPAKGGILSEYPPGMPPVGRYFPARNRIISGLSDVLLVIEARRKSGSLITVDCALEQGKSVYAVPGRVTDPLSEGCNSLIAQGAGIALSPEVVLNELGLDTYKTKEKIGGGKKSKLSLARDLELVYSCIGFQPTDYETLIAQCGYPPGQVLAVLTELQLLGLVEEVGKNYYVRPSAK